MLKTESLGNQDWYVKRSGAVFQTEQCVKRINLEAWNKMSPSLVFHMRTTFFHSSQQDLVRTAVLPSIRQWFRQCIDKPAKKKFQVSWPLPKVAGGCSRLIKQKSPDRMNWQVPGTSSRMGEGEQIKDICLSSTHVLTGRHCQPQKEEWESVILF